MWLFLMDGWRDGQLAESYFLGLCVSVNKLCDWAVTLTRVFIVSEISSTMSVSVNMNNKFCHWSTHLAQDHYSCSLLGDACELWRPLLQAIDPVTCSFHSKRSTLLSFCRNDTCGISVPPHSFKVCSSGVVQHCVSSDL